MPHVVALPDGSVLTDDAARLDMGVVHAALATAYWARGRRPADTERAFRHSLVVGLLTADGATAGFGRAVTDRTFRAHIADVMVLPAARGRGLGRALVAALLDHPELATVATWSLTTADAHGLYARFGFRASAGEPNWMVLRRIPAPDRGSADDGASERASDKAKDER